MKKVLILLNSYYPEINANMICADKYINALRQEKYQIDLFVVREDWRLLRCEKINGVNVYRFDNWYVYNIQKINRRLQENKKRRLFLKWMTFLYCFVIKAFLHLFDKINIEPISDNIIVKDWVAQAEKNHQESHYDYIITFSLPFIMARIGQEIIQKLEKECLPPKFIVYELDPFTSNVNLTKWKKFMRFIYEGKVLKKADAIIIPPELEQEFRIKFKAYYAKANILIFPILEKINIEKNSERQFKEIQCLYIGNFYDRIRNPSRVFEILGKVDGIVIHVIGGGCEKELDNIKAELGEKVQLHGRQSREDVLKAVGQANIMLSIGNSIANQTPSKVFELIAYGKPIIHFYRIDRDSSIRYLANYPNVLFVDERKQDKDLLEEAGQFVREYATKNLSYEEIVQSMKEYTTEEIVKQFMSIMHSLIE